MVRIGALAATLVIAMAGAAAAQAPSGKVAVVTSFSKDVTDPIKKAFEKAHPGVAGSAEPQHQCRREIPRGDQGQQPGRPVLGLGARRLRGAEGQEACCSSTSRRRPASPRRSAPFRSTIPKGFYFGFAASGYGIMWNERYVKANKLPEPKEWQDLAKPVYYDHVSIAAPSRSGTTHLTIETILQGEGWDKGWRTIKEMAGNFRNVTERSFGVPEAVNSGQVGYGIVIDFFAFSAQASGFPGEVRLSDRDHDRAGQCRHRRQRAEQGRRRSLRRIPAVAGRPGDAARARHPPPAGESRRSMPRRRRTIPIPSRTRPRRDGEVRRRACRRSATTWSTCCSTS